MNHILFMIIISFLFLGNTASKNKKSDRLRMLTKVTKRCLSLLILVIYMVYSHSIKEQCFLLNFIDFRVFFVFLFAILTKILLTIKKIRAVLESSIHS